MVNLLLPTNLIKEIEKFWGEITSNKGFKFHEREYFLLSLPPYVLDFTNIAGKSTEIHYAITFSHSKKGFDVFKVGESLYVSNNYHPYYSIIRKQKEEIEINIKSQLAQISSAIMDTQLIAHDYRKYKRFLKLLKNIEELEEAIRNEKDQKKLEEIKKRKKMEEMNLRTIFVDQVDVYTGDFSIISMARSRWTTLISDFLALDEEKTPEEILAKNPNITKAEAIQLAKKNRLYLEWREEFKRIVREREAELRRLLIMRKNSIDKYKEMLLPLISRYLTIREEPFFFTSASMHFIKSATYPLMIDSTKWWIIRPSPPMFQEYEKFKLTSIDLKSVGLISENLLKMLDDNVKKNLKNVTLPLEPSIDRVVLGGIEVINKNFGTRLSLEEIAEIRERIFKRGETDEFVKEAPSQERWKLSPYYVFIEISLDRTLLRTYTGIEIEDFWFEIKPFLISQNIALLMYLQITALNKYYEYEINSFFGESLMKEVELEVDVGNKKIKQKVNVWLDIRSLDYLLDEEEDFRKAEERMKSEYYKILLEYSRLFEKTFIKKGYSAPYLLYDASTASFFVDYLIITRNDLNKLIASSFGFPI